MLHAQTNKLDSLNQLIIKAKTDTAKINLVNKRIALLSNINLDSAIYHGLQNLKAAQKINYYRGELDARQKLAANYCFKGDYNKAKETLEYIRKLIKPGKDSTDVANMYGNYGMMYGMQSKYDTSIFFFKEAIKIFEKLKDTGRLSTNYSNIAIGYEQLSDFPKALEYQQKSLKLAEARNDETGQAYTLMNMANTYEELDDTARAEKYFLTAAHLAKKNSLNNVELYGYSNLASLYQDKKSWNKVYEFGMKAAELARSYGDQGIQGASLAKAATALANQNKIDEATTLNRQAIALADSSNQPLNISQANAAMGYILFLQKKYNEAIPYYEKNFRALKGSDIYVAAVGNSYKELSHCYESTGDYYKALSNFKIAADIADSIKRKENIRKATELSMNFEFEKKQQAQATEKKRQDELTKAKQTILTAGLLFTFILAVIAFTGYRNKQKTNRILLQQNQKVEDAMAELKATQKQLIESEKMASLGELTAGIAHEIQNPLNFVNNFSDINSELIDEMFIALNEGNIEEAKQTAEDIKYNLEKINHHGRRADSIVKSMLMHSRTNTGEKTPADINVLCDEYLRLSYHGLRAKDKSFNAALQTNFDEKLKADNAGNGKININRQDIGRVLLNIFNNAFYAVNEKKKLLANSYQPIVKLSTKKLDNIIEIKVEDNGNGMPQDVIDKIFQPFFTTKPTGEGTGLGLSLAYDIVTKEHNGTINVKSREGEGTLFTIELPV